MLKNGLNKKGFALEVYGERNRMVKRRNWEEEIKNNGVLLMWEFLIKDFNPKSGNERTLFRRKLPFLT